MSGCDALRLHALHDGTLDAESRAEALRHVAQCVPCTAALAELRALEALVTEGPEVPEGYFDQLPARIAARARRRAAWSRPAAWAGAIAAALLLAVVTPRLLDQSSVPADGRREPASAPLPQAAEPLPPATPTEAIPDRPPAPAAPTTAEPAPPARQRRRDESVTNAEARALPTTDPTAARERLARASAPPVAEPKLEDAAPAIAAEEAELVVAQAATAPAAAAPTPPAAEKSAARAAGFAAPAAPRASDLASARAERDRRLREAQRPGADAGARRLAFEAAAAVMRAGGDTGDRGALRACAGAYLAVASDPAERRRVRAVLQELDPS